jgi:hypothetical protein
MTAVAYPVLDREACRRNPSMIDAWRQRAHQEQARLLELAGSVDPAAPPRPQAFDPVVEFNRRMLDDLEWVAGYVAGRRDAQAARDGAEQTGPGATPDPKDGWSASRTRVDAYKLGLEDG